MQFNPRSYCFQHHQGCSTRRMQINPSNITYFRHYIFEQSPAIEQDPTFIQQTSAPGQQLFIELPEMNNPPCADQSFEPKDLEPFEENNFE